MAWAPLAAAEIGALGSIGGGLISAGGNQGAAGSQGGQVANDQAMKVAGVDRAIQSPWVQAGTGAMSQVAALLGLGQLRPSGDAAGSTYLDPNNWQDAQRNALARFQTDPGYQFRLQQGVNAIDRSGTARGMRMSGAQQKALSDYGQNTGSAEYGNYFNRLAGAANLGETAATASNAAYNQAALPGISDQFAGSQLGAGYGVAGGNALASGIIGAGNSLASGATATPWGSIFGSGGGASGVPGGPGIYANAFA